MLLDSFHYLSLFIVKLFSLFGALILSASPAWADDYLHLNCEVEVVNTKVLSATNQVLEREVNAGSIVFKIDLVNSRSKGAGSDTWEDIQIIDGVIQDSRSGEVDGFTFEAKRAVWIQPPGEFSVKTVASNDKIIVTVSTEGECSEIDALVFDEAQ